MFVLWHWAAGRGEAGEVRRVDNMYGTVSTYIPTIQYHKNGFALLGHSVMVYGSYDPDGCMCIHRSSNTNIHMTINQID